MVIYSGEGLLQTDDIKARGIADFDLVSLSQRNATNKTADIGHHMMIYSGEGLLQTDAVEARGIADFVLMSLSHCHRTRLQLSLQFRSGEFHGGQWCTHQC